MPSVMFIIYAIGILFALSLALVITMVIMARPEKPYTLEDESEDLINNKNK